MDKWIKENKITVGIIVVLILVLGLVYLNKQTPKDENQTTKNSTVASNLDLQTKCASQAEIALNNFKKDYSASYFSLATVSFSSSF